MAKRFIPVAKPIIGRQERRAVDRVLRSGMLAQGPEVAMFEEEFGAAVAGSRPCIAVNSGTSGLHLGLLAAGVGPGDEVIVPSFTFAATANAVAVTGATPVFADIAQDNYCIDPASVEAAITSKTVGIMPVHLYGHPAPMRELRAIADTHKLAIFEDAAQAHLAELDGETVGTFGQFAVFSLYPTKNMTSGEGGMVVCEDAELAEKIRLLRNQGMKEQYQNKIVGLNNRMTDIHAAIGRTQLRRLPTWTAARQRNASKLTELITSAQTPTVPTNGKHVFHQYTIRVNTARDKVAKRLKEEFSIGSGVYYPTPSHKLASLSHFPTVNELPNTLLASRTVLSLPIHPNLTPHDLQRVATAVNHVVGSTDE